MKLRPEQIDVFRKQAAVSFESRALKHLRRDLAHQTAPFGDQQLRERVRDCAARATAYGLVNERQIMCFVDVSFLLGSDFDTNVQHAWTQKVLQDRKFSATDRANLLLATACSVFGNKK